MLDLLLKAGGLLVAGGLQKRVPKAPTQAIPVANAALATAYSLATGAPDVATATEQGLLAAAVATFLHQLLKIFIRWSFPKVGWKVPEVI